MRISRRKFVKWITASGIALSLSRLALAEESEFVARETLPGRQRWNPAATGAGRIDGVAKVTGAKLYAADFRAALRVQLEAPHVSAGVHADILIRGIESGGQVFGIDGLRDSLIAQGIASADTVSTVSHKYLAEILTPASIHSGGRGSAAQ